MHTADIWCSKFIVGIMELQQQKIAKNDIARSLYWLLTRMDV